MKIKLRIDQLRIEDNRGLKFKLYWGLKRYRRIFRRI